jgi:hypothetical protein
MRPSRYSAGLAGAGETGYVLAYNTTEKQVASITKPSRMYLLYRAGWSSRLMVSPSQLRARPVMRTQPRSVLIRAAIADPKKSKLAGSRMSVYAFMGPILGTMVFSRCCQGVSDFGKIVPALGFIYFAPPRSPPESLARFRFGHSSPLERKNRKIEQIHTSWMRGVGGRFTRARFSAIPTAAVRWDRAMMSR